MPRASPAPSIKTAGPPKRLVGGVSVLFFELFFDRRADAGRRTKRLAVVVQRQPRHVDRMRAPRRLHVDDDGDRTALDAVAVAEAAAAGEPGVREPFQHLRRLYYRSALSCRSAICFVTGPRCLRQIDPSRAMKNEVG